MYIWFGLWITDIFASFPCIYCLEGPQGIKVCFQVGTPYYWGKKAGSQMQGFDCEGCEVSVRFKTFISWYAFLMQCEKVLWKEEQQQNKIHQN